MATIITFVFMLSIYTEVVYKEMYGPLYTQNHIIIILHWGLVLYGLFRKLVVHMIIFMLVPRHSPLKVVIFTPKRCNDSVLCRTISLIASYWQWNLDLTWIWVARVSIDREHYLWSKEAQTWTADTKHIHRKVNDFHSIKKWVGLDWVCCIKV